MKKFVLVNRHTGEQLTTKAQAIIYGLVAVVVLVFVILYVYASNAPVVPDPTVEGVVQDVRIIASGTNGPFWSGTQATQIIFDDGKIKTFSGLSEGFSFQRGKRHSITFDEKRRYIKKVIILE